MMSFRENKVVTLCLVCGVLFCMGLTAMFGWKLLRPISNEEENSVIRSLAADQLDCPESGIVVATEKTIEGRIERKSATGCEQQLSFEGGGLQWFAFGPVLVNEPESWFMSKKQILEKDIK